eukprot:5906411-Pleurochrysis_carterae.AAC.5
MFTHPPSPVGIYARHARAEGKVDGRRGAGAPLCRQRGFSIGSTHPTALETRMCTSAHITALEVDSGGLAPMTPRPQRPAQSHREGRLPS